MYTELGDGEKVKNRLVRGYGIVAAEQEVLNGTESSGLAYFYYHGDEHNDVSYITGEDGYVKNRYEYDAFGCQTRADEIIRNRYGYNGEQYDGVTEQYYLRARFYNPAVARFTQEDVYRGDGLNLYAYCGNNAVMYEDPSGYGKKNKPKPISKMSYDEIKMELNEAYEDFVKKKNKSISSTGNGLLENELNYGKYGSLPKPSEDNLTGHHMPSNDKMKKDFDVPTSKSWAMNLEQPNSAGRHRRTFTYGLTADSRNKQLYDALTPRDALAFDVKDAKRILKEDGIYDSHARKQLSDYIKSYTNDTTTKISKSNPNLTFKEIFDKKSKYNKKSSKCRTGK